MIRTRWSARLGRELTKSELAQLDERLEARGATYVVQEIAPLALAPVFDGGAIAAGPAGNNCGFYRKSSMLEAVSEIERQTMTGHGKFP